jgi:acetyltransferase-like isoleucine patch superfamily enzyme
LSPQRSKERAGHDRRIAGIGFFCGPGARLMPIAPDVKLGPEVLIHHPELVNLYGCSIGARSTVGPFVEIQRGVQVGSRCKISSHCFLCEGVTIEDEVFLGHGVIFVNDKEPRAAIDGRLAGPQDWVVAPTVVKKGAAIGSGALIMGGITIGAGALVGAGAVVTGDVADATVVAGVPARLLRTRK